jgi:MYXO-CTERM domain-containing protein
VCVAIPEEAPPAEETSSSSGDAAESGEDGCNVSPDPTNPVPWRPAILGLVGLAALLRRRRRA